MGSLAQPQASLVDLLDRVLDRGLMIQADIIITLAGVPLIGIKLQAALAGMETMVHYGLLEEWDQEIRTGRGAHEAHRRLIPMARPFPDGKVPGSTLGDTRCGR
jgi:hypothetical protein